MNLTLPNGMSSFLDMYLDTQNVFFTSDTHIGHSNVIKFDNRPFADVEEMNETIVKNWNNKIPKDGIVFFMGDFSFKSLKQTKEIFDQLNGQIHWINGNHDTWKVISKLDKVKSIQNMLDLKIADKDVVNKRFKGRQQITLCHYPIVVWDKHHHGAWHLHGHCHHNLTKTAFGEIFYKRKVIDVGTNGHEHTPLSYQDVKDIMNQKTIDLIDQI